MSRKRHANTLADVIKKYNIKIQIINVGRSMVNLLVAPPEMQAMCMSQEGAQEATGMATQAAANATTPGGVTGAAAAAVGSAGGEAEVAAQPSPGDNVPKALMEALLAPGTTLERTPTPPPAYAAGQGAEALASGGATQDPHAPIRQKGFMVSCGGQGGHRGGHRSGHRGQHRGGQRGYGGRQRGCRGRQRGCRG